MYALLDWDSTLRESATIFTWMNFLIERGVLSEKRREEQEAIMEEYRRGLFDHDELSCRVNRHYMDSMTGMSLEDYRKNLRLYLDQDRGPDLPTTRAVTRWLREQGVDIIVVSGSPLRAIAPNFPWMGVKEAFALEEGVTDGQLDGRLLADGGYNKERVVALCRERYGEGPVLAMGDSASDIPLLRAARLPVMVNPDQELREAFPTALAIRQDEEGARLLIRALDRTMAAVS